jgi:hypothetical protein
VEIKAEEGAMRLTSVFALLGLSLITTTSNAGGLFGDAINVIAPGVGTALDKEHDRFKQNHTVYKQIEEGASGAVRHATTEAFVESTWPLLAAAINQSRTDALNAGVSPIPDDFKQALSLTVPWNILNHARWRVGGGGDLTLQVNAFRYGDQSAITLNEVIVFRSYSDANDLALWAHELHHVQQYASGGVHNFAKRYIRNWSAVEQEAKDASSRFVAAYQRSTSVASSSPYPAPQAQNSNICRVPPSAQGCLMPGFAPIGTPCWCATAFGPMQGMISF